MDFENDIVHVYNCSYIPKNCTDAMDEYTSCLHIPSTVVWKHITEGKETKLRMQMDTAIPLTINIFEKVCGVSASKVR